MQRTLIEVTLRHGCFPVHLLYIFRTPFPVNSSGWLLLSPSKFLCNSWSFSGAIGVLFLEAATGGVLQKTCS